MIVLDASVLIGYLDARDAHHAEAAAVLTAEAADSFAVNVLTLAEVLVAPTRRGLEGTVREVVTDLAITTLTLPADAASSLARLRAETGLKMPDCCVVLSALDRGTRLATFDQRLAHAAGALGIEVVTQAHR